MSSISRQYGNLCFRAAWLAQFISGFLGEFYLHFNPSFKVTFETVGFPLPSLISHPCQQLAPLHALVVHRRPIYVRKAFLPTPKVQETMIKLSQSNPTSVSSAPTPTTTVVSTPTSTPPVISSETHDLRNRRAAFDKRYNTSEMTDDEVLGKNLLSMVNTLLTNS